jgi:hypothetical protein
MHVISFDFEAAGGIPLKNGFTQLGAVLFNMETGLVEDSFNEYASMSGYEWCKRCIDEFWSKFPERFEETRFRCMVSKIGPYEIVEKFVNWCRTHSERLKHDVYMITDCSTFDSGLLKTFSKVDTIYILTPFYRDIVDVSSVYLGLSRKYVDVNHVDGSAFDNCVKHLNIIEKFTPSTFHDHHPVNDATVIAEKWYFINKFLSAK